MSKSEGNPKLEVKGKFRGKTRLFFASFGFAVHSNFLRISDFEFPSAKDGRI